MSYRKNVFLLGAGASAHAGAPLMKDFLQVAEDLAGLGTMSPEDTARFRRVLEFRADVEGAEAKAGLDLTNIEDLFGLVDANVRVKPSEPDALQLRKDFIFLILRTLDEKVADDASRQAAVYTRVGGAQPLSDGDRTASQQFVDLVARRWAERPADGVARDSIITLNYDLVIEGAMAQRGLLPDYCLNTEADATPGTNATARIKLLKLHGSANWAVCPVCHSTSVVPEGVRKIESSVCSCNKNLDVLVVPPTWSKGDYPKALDRVWEAAFHELRSAGRLILVGLSMPESDRFLRFLFGLALAENRYLDRIVIVNPAASDELYGGLFKGLPKRVQRKPIPKNFSEVVFDASLQLELGQRYRSLNRSW